jgi:tyrosine-protein phosphatase SIW14
MNPQHFLRSQHFAKLIVAVALASAGFAAPSAAANAAHNIQGVGNFQKVDEHVFRGAQPSHQGFVNLSKLGIQTVVDLREPGDRSATERKWVTDAGMRYVSVPMYGMATPSKESVLKVLALLEDRGTGPVFVHCKRGADRTGGVIACYRVEHDHWKNDRALAEARSLGMSWFQTAIQGYVRKYQPRDLTALAPKTLDASATVLAPVQP